MKLIKKSLIVVILMSVVLSSLLLINPVLATSDVNYTFQDNVMYDDTSDNYLSYYTDRNYKNYSEYTQHYNGTYSFENDVIGDEPEDWTSYNNPPSANITAEYNGHSEVLNFTTDNTSQGTLMDFPFSVVDYVEIEFWFLRTQSAGQVYFRVFGDTNNDLYFNSNGAVTYRDSVGAYPTITTLTIGAWSHWRLEYNISRATNDIFDCYVDGILEVDDGLMYADMTYMDQVRIQRGNADSTYYWDAFSFSWDGYNATYSFDNEVGNTGTNIDGIDYVNIGGVGSVECISYLDGHYNVVNITSDGSGVNMYNSFGSYLTSGVFETWVYTNDASQQQEISLREGSSRNIWVYIVADQFKYRDGTGFHSLTPSLTALDDTWYHLKYEWFSNNSYKWYINGILVLENSMYISMTQGIERFYPLSYSTSIYYDAFGHTWDSFYTEGDNLEYYASYDNYVPYLNDTSDKYEVDRFEFAFEGFEDLYEVGEDIYSNWTEIDSGSDFCNIDSDPVSNTDRRIKIENQAPSVSDAGIEKEFYIDSGILNVTWSVEYDTTSALNEFRTKIYSSDDTLIAHLYFLSNFLRGVDDSGTYELYTSITTSEVYEMNWYINQFDQISILRFYIDGVLEGVYNISLIASGKDGLGKIEMYNDASASTSELYLDYVGVYINGTSISEEFGHRKIRYLTLDEPTLNWDFQEHNLFQFDAIGNLSFYVAEPSYIMGVSTIVNLVPFNIYNGINTYNVYDVTFDGNSYIYIPYVWIVFYNDVALNNITINGVELTDGSNNYSLEFTSGNIETNESFFYLDTNNYLTWNLQFNDTNTEYIQANFDIIDFSDDNYSMYNYGYEHGNGYGYFGVNYADSSSITFDMPTSLTPINNYLNTQKDITEIVILVTDADEYSSGSNTGKVYYINFNYITSADLTLATLTLTNVILNLIVILIPSLLIYYAFDKKRDVLLISIILMLVVCFATDLIPMWLFFLGLMCMGTFFFIKTEDENF